MRPLALTAPGLALGWLCLWSAHPAHAQVDRARAQAYFDEAAELCEIEDGRLWGISLCGPMVFADPQSGEVALNAPEPDAPRPRVLGYANAALEWGDERWATFVWPMIPEEKGPRTRMMLHELFHRIQPELGLYVARSEGENDHLDTPEGRYWIQLEWLALAEALRADGSQRKSAIRDALAFRSARRMRFPGAAERERISEINEGLAQYTGTRAAAGLEDRNDPDRAARQLAAAVADALQQLTDALENESFVRTFAYPSGSAYGLLLDAWAPGWTRTIDATDDLGHLLMGAATLEPAASAEAASRRYGGDALWAVEQAREAERQARIAELRARFVDGPVLVVPRGSNASFITTGVTPIPDAGTIYPTFRVTGEWGSIKAEQVLMSLDGAILTVPGPFSREGSTLSGERWRVALAPGWTVCPGPREGDFRVVREEGPGSACS